MSAIKRWLEDLSVVAGGDGKITPQIQKLGQLLLEINDTISLDPKNRTIKFCGTPNDDKKET